MAEPRTAVTNLLPREWDALGLSNGNMLANFDGYPQLNADVFLVGNCFRDGAITMLAKAGCRQAESIQDADLVVFLGGEDINPLLYGDSEHSSTYCNYQRDDREAEIFKTCVEFNIPMLGICRGMQLIHALNGGRLWQNVDGHTRHHQIQDCMTGQVLTASSMHHQMAMYGSGDEPKTEKAVIPVALAYRPVATVFETDRRMFSTNTMPELEAAFYPEINAFAVQGHPEIGGYFAYTKWVLGYVKELLEGESEAYAAVASSSSVETN